MKPKTAKTANKNPLPPPLKTVPQMRSTARKEGAMNNDLTILYERLSREDERENESVSIENQKAFLEDYATKNGFQNIVHMPDDGWSVAMCGQSS